jgi:hypothetical protein
LDTPAASFFSDEARRIPANIAKLPELLAMIQNAARRRLSRSDYALV